MAFKPIQIVINAKDNASAVFGRLEGRVKAVGIAIAGYFGVKAFAGGIQGAADFEAAMSRVKAATDGTAEEMQQLTKAAQDAGANTKYTSIEAAGALENLAKAGLSAGDSVKALPAVLALAQAGDVELAAASEYVTKAVMGMGLAFDDAARVSDVLAKGANATNTSVEGLAQALSYAAPVANSLGVSLESTVAMVGKFADAGIDASRAGTALNSIMSQFANPASTFRKELGAAGIVTTDFDKAIRQLAASGPAGERAINAVGMEAGPALRALLNQGMGSLDELAGKLKDAAGSADATAKAMSDNLNGSIQGLGSVWDAAVQVLNTPVLPVLRKGVDELTASIRGAIADGTVAKFGQTLATAFEQGLKYFREFAANVNFDAVVLRLRVFASETQETLQRIGMFATNAGNSVQLAWGVMTAGVQGVLTAIYGVGAVFSEVAAKFMQGLAVLREGLAAVSFGSLSESFKLAAEDARLAAQGFGEAADAFKAKATESLQGMADGAETARAGWAGLTGAVQESAAAMPEAAKSIEQVAASIEAQGQATSKAQAAADAKAASDKAAAESVKRLKEECEDLIRSGNLQEAAKRLLEIDRAQQKLSGSAKNAGDAAARIEQAYKNLGLRSSAELKEAAEAARESFVMLEKEGSQPPQRIAEAWKVMAERVIAANGGIAPSWLKTEAAVKGYEVAVDRAGKSVVSTEKATLRATGNMAKGYQALGDAADDAERRMQRVGGGDKPDRQHHPGPDRKPEDDHKPGDDNKPDEERKPPPGRKRPYIPKGPHKPFANGSVSTVGKSQTNSIMDLVPVFETEKELDAWWKEWQRQYKEQNPFDVKSRGQLGNYQYAVTQFAMEGARKQIKLTQAAKSAREDAKPRDAQLPPWMRAATPSVQLPAPVSEPVAMPVAAPAPAAAAAPVVQVHRHEFDVGGRKYGPIDTDAAGSNALNELMQALKQSAQMAGRA